MQSANLSDNIYERRARSSELLMAVRRCHRPCFLHSASFVFSYVSVFTIASSRHRSLFLINNKVAVLDQKANMFPLKFSSGFNGEVYQVHV